MKVIVELNIDANLNVEALEEIGSKVTRVLDNEGPIHVYPRMLVELGPNYLELPMKSSRPSKSVPV